MPELAERLGELESRFRILADSAPVLVWMAGTDKLCDWFNAGWLAFTGRTMEQEYGNGWIEGLHPDDYDRCLDVYGASFDARTQFRMEYRLRRHDGEYRWLLNTGTPRYTPNGVFSGYIGSCIDIHSQHQAREELTRSLDAQARLLAEKDALLKEVHHRVKNNLQLIMSLLGIRARDVESPEIRSELEDMASRIGNLAQLEEVLHRSPDLTVIDLGDYLQQLASKLIPADEEEDKAGFDLQPVRVAIDRAISLGLLVTEILLSAQRQAQDSEGRGIRLALRTDEPMGSAVLSITSATPVLPAETTRKSMGRRLIDALSRQAEAELSAESTDSGWRVLVRFTVSAE